jgi:hypothetical protein
MMMSKNRFVVKISLRLAALGNMMMMMMMMWTTVGLGKVLESI